MKQPIEKKRQPKKDKKEEPKKNKPFQISQEYFECTK